MKMKGYKAFSHGMICRKGEENEKQYAENTTYEENGGEICSEGMMHFCANPLDCLDYYNLIDDDGNLVEIAEVEGENPITDDNKKYASKKLHIGAKIENKELGRISAQVIRESVERETKAVISGGNCAQQVGGYGAKQVVGYDAQQIGGNCAQQVGGNCVKQVVGDYAQQIGGNCAQQVGGYSAKQVGGYCAKQVGDDFVKQVGDGFVKQVGGDYAQQIGGNCAQQVGGYGAKQVGGYCAQQIGGNCAKQVGDNYAQQIGGNKAKQQAGENSILVAGENSMFKAGLHSVVLHYWYDDNGDIGGFKAAQVDGIKIKPDTWYKLQDGEFVEV